MLQSAGVQAGVCARDGSPQQLVVSIQSSSVSLAAGDSFMKVGGRSSWDLAANTTYMCVKLKKNICKIDENCFSAVINVEAAPSAKARMT